VKRAARFRREVGTARVDDERLALYAKWHGNREQVWEWSPSEHTAESYARDFAAPHPCLREVTFCDDDAGGRLVGVGLWDDMPNSASAIFFFYDPALEHESLGVANVVLGIEAAKRAGKAHVYLGYSVANCASLRYKSAYRPHEVLTGRPTVQETPVWVAAG
jgi:arginine-tRNA-protein transferase